MDKEKKPEVIDKDTVIDMICQQLCKLDMESVVSWANTIDINSNIYFKKINEKYALIEYLQFSNMERDNNG